MADGRPCAWRRGCSAEKMRLYSHHRLFQEVLREALAEHQGEVDYLTAAVEQVFQKAPADISQRYRLEMDGVMARWKRLGATLEENGQKIQELMAKLMQFENDVKTLKKWMADVDRAQEEVHSKALKVKLLTDSVNSFIAKAPPTAHDALRSELDLLTSNYQRLFRQEVWACWCELLSYLQQENDFLDQLEQKLEETENLQGAGAQELQDALDVRDMSTMTINSSIAWEEEVVRVVTGEERRLEKVEEVVGVVTGEERRLEKVEEVVGVVTGEERRLE
ncbi:hypothetical protein CRUP_037331 [Coryphaenoides rupestris]|nr:hypothetical protein CRUP_037331 [Coryphaenoides rupestris]